MKWDEITDGLRVVDMRTPEVAGTCEGTSDAVTQIARVRWDEGKASQIWVGVLAREEGR